MSLVDRTREKFKYLSQGADKTDKMASVSSVGASPTGIETITAIERRRARVERELTEHPEQRVAVEAVDAPLHAEPGEPVSVVIAVRTAVGIVSGELHVPRERFDAALFFRMLEETSKRPSRALRSIRYRGRASSGAGFCLPAPPLTEAFSAALARIKVMVNHGTV